MEEEAFRGFVPNGETVFREGLERLRELLGGARMAMLTTLGPSGVPHSRPMAVQQIDDDGDAWLLTEEGTAKVQELVGTERVGLAWHRPVRGRWVAACGRATIVQDRERVRQLWDPTMQLWFPRGPADPRLCLIRVRLEEAQAWDLPLAGIGRISRAAGLALGREVPDGEPGREAIVLRGPPATPSALPDQGGASAAAGAGTAAAASAVAKANPAGAALAKAAPGKRASTQTTPAKGASRRGRAPKASAREPVASKPGRRAAEARRAEEPAVTRRPREKSEAAPPARRTRRAPEGAESRSVGATESPDSPTGPGRSGAD